jgi:DNA-directed RNA polymerase specialized sigma24 family protein
VNAPEDRRESGNEERLSRWLALAREGDESALGRLLEAFRDPLRIQARQDLRADLAPRVEASDIVQRTCLSAVRHFEDFRGLVRRRGNLFDG